MTFLQGAESAVVPDDKVRDYLLNPANPENRGKAALFEAFGFTSECWEVLADALRSHPLSNEIARTVPSAYGTKYVVRCSLITPDGRSPCRTSIWIVEDANGSPRLITAY